MKHKLVTKPTPNWPFVAAIIALVGFGALMYFLSTSGPDNSSFAQCLSDKGAVMYGAHWCPHCAAQKTMIGLDAFELVNYVECATGGPKNIPAQPQLCKEKGIESYPTWIFADGSRLTGEQELEVLGRKTGCAVTAE